MVYELVKTLQKHSLTVTTAESCTGGGIVARIVDVPGASDVLREAVVTYTNESKHKRLGVEEETLAAYGAVSEETAMQMAIGACRYASADLSLVSTGIAGPGGGTPTKPVGLVYIGACFRGTARVERHIFSGNRTQVREQAVSAAVALGLQLLKEAYPQ